MLRNVADDWGDVADDDATIVDDEANGEQSLWSTCRWVKQQPCISFLVFCGQTIFCGFSSAFVLDAFVWGSFTVSPRFSELVFVSVKFFPSGISCWSSNVVQATTLVALFRVGSGHHSYCLNSLAAFFCSVRY